ncbi:hypothetical protein Mapa_010395 [Marchantia paleacea]|nr:hypothetical protein Mapa_010395 [Marchantia paleacea]
MAAAYSSTQGINFPSLSSVLWVAIPLVAVASLCPPWRAIRFLRRLRTYASKSSGITWRNKYISFEDMHAFFDRGDAMMAGMLVATTLQFAHGEVAKVLETHSMYKIDPWRRMVRTLTFIHITVHANSAQRSQIVSWLNRLHANIRLFEFETNVFILATIAYGLAQGHQALGCLPDGEKDAIVSSIMNMANKLNADDRHKPMPTTFSAVEKYLSAQLNSVHLRSILANTTDLLDVTQKGRSRISRRTFLLGDTFLVSESHSSYVSQNSVNPGILLPGNRRECSCLSHDFSSRSGIISITARAHTPSHSPVYSR